MQGSTKFIAEVVLGAESLMRYMKSPSSGSLGFLDCHDWTAKWTERIDDIKRKLVYQGYPSAQVIMYQVQVHFLRKETADGVSGGEHVALAVLLKDCCLLIDHTHNQFDVPIGVVKDKAAIQAHHAAIYQNMETYIGHENTLEAAIVKWLALLQGKTKIREVQRSGLRYYSPEHRFS